MLLENSTKGILVVVVAGFSNGSFPAPSKGITAWKWEHIWLIYSFCAMAFLPLGLALVAGHEVIPELLANDLGLALKIAGFGALWGLGSLLFGISLARLGMAITNAMVNGIVVFLGSLSPILLGAVHVGPKRFMWLIGGLSLLALSLVLCAAASVSRDRVQRVSSASSGSTRQSAGKSVGAVLLAVAAGVLSSMLQVGFVVGAPLAEKAKVAGFPAALATVSIWVPVLLGGLVFNMGYPAYLISKGRSWSTLVSARGSAFFWVRCFSMGVFWFAAIQLYGLGASMMGHAGPVYGWAIIIAVSILTSNTWGALTGEWKGSDSRPKLLMWLSTALLIGSLVVLTLHQAPN